MVAINPFSYEQVAIIFIFLSVLLGILLYVRKNSDKLNFKLQTEKSISVMTSANNPLPVDPSNSFDANNGTCGCG